MASDDLQSTQPTEKVVSLEGPSVLAGLGDEELLKIIKQDARRDEGKFQELIKANKKNEDYFLGNQIDKSKLHPGDAQIVINRIIVSIETMVSIITSITPSPWVIVTPKTAKSRRFQNKLERMLTDQWEYFQNLQQKMEKMLRIYFMAKIGFIKVKWDEVEKDYVCEVVRPEKLRYDLEAASIDKSSYIIEYVESTLDELVIRFPESKEYLEQEIAKTKAGGRSKVTYLEYWGRYRHEDKMESFVCWNYKDKILGKDKNPHWRENGQNHFKSPRNPYVSMGSLSLGKGLVDDTSLVTQAIPVQDGINKRKRQIDKNAGMANGTIVTSAAAMEKSTFDKIQNTEMEKIFLDKEVEDVDRAFRKVTGRSLDSGIYDDMYHSIREIDNIFGTHDTTRGEKTSSETLGGRQMLRDADFGRLDLTTRAYEQVAEDLYNWMIQMMMVHYKEGKEVVSEREMADPKEEYKMSSGLMDAADSSDIIKRDDFDKYRIKVVVKKGATRPKDPAAEEEQVLTLAQVGQIDPITFFEKLGFDNPRLAARRLYLWNNDPSALFPEIGGEDFIDPEAIQHIMDINSGANKAGDQELFEQADLTKIDRYQRHVDTHSMYMKGIEVDEDLAPYPELPDEIKEAHMEHLELETERLRALVAAEQERSMISGGVLPEEAMGQALPEEGQLPEEGLEGMAPPVESPAAPTMGTGTLAGGELGI